MVTDNTSGRSIPCSHPVLLSANDLRIIRSALIKCRKTSGSVRADQIIEMISFALDHPDSCSFDFDPDKTSVVIPFV